MTEQEVKDQIARLLAVRFVYECDANTYPFNLDGLSENGKERAMKDAGQIFRLIQQAGYVLPTQLTIWDICKKEGFVLLSKDQSVPEIPSNCGFSLEGAYSQRAISGIRGRRRGYVQAQQDMLEANFRKVE